MVDRTQEDINQDAQLARIKKQLDALESKVDRLQSEITYLHPVISAFERIEDIVNKILGKLHV